MWLIWNIYIFAPRFPAKTGVFKYMRNRYCSQVEHVGSWNDSKMGLWTTSKVPVVKTNVLPLITKKFNWDTFTCFTPRRWVSSK